MTDSYSESVTGSPRLSKCNLVSSETNLGTFLTLLAVAAKTFFEVELVPVTLDSIGKRETTTKLSKRSRNPTACWRVHTYCKIPSLTGYRTTLACLEGWSL